MRVALRFYPWFAFVVAAALLWVAAAAFGAARGHQSADGMEVYLGVLPAEVIEGHEIVHGERPRAEVGDSHLVVALFDQVSGERVEDARVSARLRHNGHTGPEQMLEPMEIADTITYGNFFTLPEEGGYSIQLRIERQDTDDISLVEFGHEHFAR